MLRSVLRLILFIFSVLALAFYSHRIILNNLNNNYMAKEFKLFVIARKNFLSAGS